MPDVLEFFRSEDPRLKDVPDEDLTRFITAEHPEFLKDREFLDTAGKAVHPPSAFITDDVMEQRRKLAATPPAPENPHIERTKQAEQLKAQYEWRKGASGDDPVKQTKAKALYLEGLRDLGIEPISDLPSPITSAGRLIGPPLAAGGKVMGAAAGDVVETLSGEPGVPNLRAFANNPEAPLPITEELKTMPAWARIPGKVTQTVAQAIPRIGAAVAGGMAGLSAPLANVGAMGFDDQGNIDPVGVLAATGLPMVDKLGRQLAASAIQKTLARPIVVDAPGQLAAKVAAHYPALQKESVQKALEVAGGQLANNAYLLALQTPGILQADNPGQALEDALVGNLALSIMGAGELNKGRSMTMEQLSGKAGRGEPILNVELQQPPATPTAPVTKNVTPSQAPSQSIAGPSEASPAPSPAPPNTPVVPGRATTVLGANDAKLPAFYAWAPASGIQSSHGGESFSVNPAYAPLKNTRRYDSDQAERDKVLKGAGEFNPQSYATNVRGAAEGPVMISQGSDGVLRVLGGNGRMQMIQRLTPEQREQFGAVQDEEAATFGLPARPSPDHLLVRLMQDTDVSTPAGIEAANRTVDLLNPSPGLVEATASMARNDAAKVPAPVLNQIRPDSTPAQMRQWITGLLTDGTLDRNTRTQIAGNDSQLTDYVQRLLVQAAYHSDVVNEFRHDAKTGETTRALIDTGIPFLTELRAKGEAPTAQAFTELVTRAADYQRQNSDRKLDDILQQIHAQTEAGETSHGTLARGLALALSGQVERLPANKRGERKIDADETRTNFQTFFDALARSVKQAEAVPDLFGNTRTPSEAISDFIRSKVGDEPMVLKEPSRRVDLLSAVPVTRGETAFGTDFEQARKWAMSHLRQSPVTNGRTGLTVTIGRKAIEKATSGSAMKGALAAHHLAALQQWPELLRQAVPGEVRPDRSGDPNIKALHRWYAPLTVGGVLYRVKLTVKEYARQQPGIYTHELVEMEMPAGKRVDAYPEGLTIPTPQAGTVVTVADLLGNVNGDDGQPLLREVGENPAVTAQSAGGAGEGLAGEPTYPVTTTAGQADDTSGGAIVNDRFAPDPRVVRLNKLNAIRQERKLTALEEQQREALEIGLGQNFMAFWNEHQGQQREAEQLTLLENGRRLAPHETGEDILEERRRKGKDARQLEFDAIAQAELLGRLGPLPRPERGSGDVAGDAGTGPISLLAKVVRDDFHFQGGTTLLGKTIANVDDAAVAFQVLRNPKFEIFHWVLVKEGKVVGLYSVTARIPNTAFAWAGKDTVQTIKDLMLAKGADGFYNVHNHPSGDPTPSGADQSTTIKLAEAVGGFLGHIVTNHTRYGFVDRTGRQDVRSLPGAHPAQDPLLWAGTNQPLGDILGAPVQGWGDKVEHDSIAGFASRVAQHTDADVVSLLFTDARSKVRAIGHVSVNDFLDEAKFTRHLQDTARTQGASMVYAYHTGNGNVVPAVDRYVRDGVLWQALTPGANPHTLRVATKHVFGHPYESGTDWEALQNAREKWVGYDPVKTDALRMAESSRREQMSSPALTITFANAPVKSGRTPMALQMGGMQHVKPVEMPELVKLATELMGEQPGLKKFKKAAGMFYHGPGGVAIKLDPRIFTNSADAAKVLAHELGHLIDYLPNHTLKRGNLVGRLYTLSQFLKNSFGPGAVQNKDLRDELIALTQYWHPYDPVTVPASYKAYRESAKELYADAISVLLNSPGLLEQMAPKFYQKFWEQIDRKPEVKQSLFDLQDLLNKGKIPVIEQRAADRETMFTKGDEILKRKAAEREARSKSWTGYWLELKQTLFDKFEPVVQKARAAEAAGASFAPNTDPRNLLEEGAMTDNTNTRFVRAMFEGVIQPIEDAGITVNQLGDYLFLRRITAGDRSAFANPLGTTPETARLDLLKMRLDLGMDGMTRLETAVQKFHDLAFEVVEEAVAVGSYSKEIFDSRIKPNKDVYAAFAVLDYLEDYVPAGVKQQVGTLKEIANPFTATVLKTIALNNLNSIQRSKNATRDLLQSYFSTEIEPAKTRFIAPGFTGNPPPKADRGILQILENGQPAYYYVDPLIAHAFERLTPQGLGRMMRVLDFVFRQGFYKLYITYSPSFLLFNPVRDFSRAWKSLPAPLPFSLGLSYFKAFSSAVSHVRGLPDGLAREMEANFAIGGPSTSLVQSHRDDAFGDVMRKFELLPEKERHPVWDKWFMRPAVALDRGFQFFGAVQEALPKMAAYRILRKDFGLSPEDAAAEVRNHIGTPNTAKHGTAIRVIRPVLPFFNVFAQGARADLRKINPKSQSGWLWKWAATDGLWAILSGVAAAGLLGAGLKELFGGMSEYDKTNYNILPVGKSVGGDFGMRVHYVRLPRDESSRLMSGLTYKLTRLLAGSSPEQFTDLFAFGAGQMPSINPAVSIPAKWMEYATGHNPTDPFRGRPIIGRSEFTAGGMASLKPMLSWTLGQSGAGNFVSWNDEAQTTTELTLSAIPGLKNLMKTSDYGFREQQQAREDMVAQERARHLLSLPDDAVKLAREYGSLKNLDLIHRTPAQESRYVTLNIWHNTIYRDLEEKIYLADQAKAKDTSAFYRARLAEQSRTYAKP